MPNSAELTLTKSWQLVPANTVLRYNYRDSSTTIIYYIERNSQQTDQPTDDDLSSVLKSDIFHAPIKIISESYVKCSSDQLVCQAIYNVG